MTESKPTVVAKPIRPDGARVTSVVIIAGIVLVVGALAQQADA